MQGLISLENIVKRREKSGSKFQLNVPEFSVLPGEFVAIVGESGCGKSTLMDMLALVLKPTSAEIFIVRDDANREHDVEGLWAAGNEEGLANIRRDLLGYVLQTGGLFPYLTVKANAMLPRKLKGLSEDMALLERTASQIGLAISTVKDREDAEFNRQNYDFSLLDKKPRHLSGGQRQRAAILRSLFSEPSIILADEPTAAVDKLTAENIISQFKTAAYERKVSVVMVTHDRDIARKHVDKAYLFEQPKIDSDTGFINSTLNVATPDSL